MIEVMNPSRPSPSPPQRPPPLVIGIDVGGTNTDAVALRGPSLLASAKVATTPDITGGIRLAVARLSDRLNARLVPRGSSDASGEGSAPSPAELGAVRLGDAAAVFVGTTALLNALLEGRGLLRVAVVRVTGPSSRSLPPLADFPPSLRDVVCAGVHFAAGGLRFDGTEECCVDDDELKDVADRVGRSDARTVLVSGTFSPADGRQEEHAAEVLRRHLPEGVRVTLASRTGGGLGLLARENSAVLDAALYGVAGRASRSARRALGEVRGDGDGGGLTPKCRYYFTSNDGSAVPFGQAAESPLRCAVCGPANSMRGAAYLASMMNGGKVDSGDETDTGRSFDACGAELPPAERPMDRIVLDVGGTSTDAGCLVSGIHPRHANAEPFVAGVRCNHRTTDVVSIALGGGSIVKEKKEGGMEDGGWEVGPESVGANISQRALCFGGDVLTATCVAVAMGARMTLAPSNEMDFGGEDGAKRPSMDWDVASFGGSITRAWDVIQQKFYNLVDMARTDDKPVEVIVVGGGAGLVDKERLSRALGNGCSVAVADHASVANAIGSALAHAVGEAETIADFSMSDRDEVLAPLRQKACDAAGPAARVVECEEVPLAYLPGKMVRVSVRAHAPLDIFAQGSCSDDKEAQDDADLNDGLSEDDVENDSDNLPALRAADTPSFLPCAPRVDQDGVWHLSEYDAHCVAIGAGILGCGGGGSTHHGLLQLLSALRESKPIRVISAKSVPNDALVAPCGFMGAPTVSLETIGNPANLAAAVRKNLEATSSKSAPSFITVSEIGGSNGLKPLVVGGIMNLTVVDADLMGRAFPELQMMTPAIYGLPQTPMTAADAFGRCVTLDDRRSSHDAEPADAIDWVERVLRPVSIEFGCSAAVADPVLSGTELRRVGVLGSISRAQRIGDCILQASHAGEAIGRLLKREGGRLIFEGKVSDVQRETTKGFAKGRLKILGNESDNASVLEIEFQNEFIIARLTKDGETSVVGCVPDIIALLDAETARPIATEEVRFGFRVYAVLLPISPLLRSKEALSVVGPSAFGLTETYLSPLYDAMDEDILSGRSIAET